MRRREPNNARYAAEKLEATRLQLEQDEKQKAEANRSLTPGAAKLHATGRWALMVHLVRIGALQYANANPVEEARLAWELAGDLIARREVGQREEHPALPEERPSVAPGEGPPEM